MTAREELAAVIKSVTDLWDEPLDEVHDIPPLADALLASPALARVIREAKAEAWDECSRLAVRTLGFPSPNPYRDQTEVAP